MLIMALLCRAAADNSYKLQIAGNGVLFNSVNAVSLFAKMAANTATDKEKMVLKMLANLMAFSKKIDSLTPEEEDAFDKLKEAYHALQQEVVIESFGPYAGDLWKTFDTKYVAYTTYASHTESHPSIEASTSTDGGRQ